MKNLLVLLVTLVSLNGCTIGSVVKEGLTGEQFDDPIVSDAHFLNRKENKVKPPVGGPIPVAVYSFQDRKSTRLNSSHIPLSRMPSSA